MKQIKLLCAILVVLTAACDNEEKEVTDDKPVKPAIAQIAYQCTQNFPHDTNAFTEGLLIHDGKLFESTGATAELLFTRSLFGVVDTHSGKIAVRAEIDRDKYFGEGICFFKDKIYQLTYQNKIGFIYDAKTFKQTGQFTIPSPEGWGLTTDGVHLIMSDGSNKLSYLDPGTLQVVKTLSVTENGYAKDNLNELEYIKGFLYANIWLTNTIVKIDPADGSIVGMLDLTALANEAKSLYANAQEMNGIAYDSIQNKVLITGKLWPKFYVLQLSQD